MSSECFGKVMIDTCWTIMPKICLKVLMVRQAKLWACVVS